MIGVLAGAVCFFASTEIKRWLGYDDSLYVFGVHGVGGIWNDARRRVRDRSRLGGAGRAEWISWASSKETLIRS